MARFYFSFHECDGSVTNDAVGADLADLADARDKAVAMARGIMAAEVQRGRLCLSCWIVISDHNHHSVGTLHFGDAIAMVAAPSCAASQMSQPARSAAVG